MAQPEYWLRGPVAGIPALLQPAAHALLQARDEVAAAMENFRDEWLWIRPAANASVAFHLQHLAGVLDRLYTYASAQPLNEEQLEYLRAEGREEAGVTAEELLSHFSLQVEKSLAYLAGVDEQTLTDIRGVGRQQVPSTVIGLLFHAAEHTTRHTGQLLVTASVVRHEYGDSL
ncbi:MAG: DinB family protein [Terrimonas ferruginea]|uniref:DinB family protein n=1 Tax=Terrimonas ferruginea TaxID=249 RepID=UPI0009269F5D|nr:DinB family protein [Terrimonas ferruginea]MBN8782956.1 DinB family protein [Terrimonas ferruginea]OJW44143.1 MAG: metal-dependent hydrolase [Sphingobacteriales bacterium 48-107]